MNSSLSDSPVKVAWAAQRIWSLTANRLKRRIDWARTTALLLVIAAAVSATAATQASGISSALSRWLAAASAITAGLGTWMQRYAGTDQIRAWSRARSASEGLKTEIYSALAGGSHYQCPDRERVLRSRTGAILDQVSDLARHHLGVRPDRKPLPAIRDLDSYITLRVNDQINRYYIPRALLLERRVRRLRHIGDLLGLIAVILAGLVTALDAEGLAVWIPVLTTIATALAVHIAAARYDHLVLEYLRTAQRLTRLRDDQQQNPAAEPASFIDACEDAISVENQAWMAHWNEATSTPLADPPRSFDSRM